MANILSQVEKILEDAVLAALREEVDERGLQLKTAEKIEKDKRSLDAKNSGDKSDEVEEAEDDDPDEESDANADSDAGGDMSRRKVKVAAELPSTLTIDMIVQGIDSLRSARSLKDPAVFADLEVYWEGLAPPEKIALLAFINGLAETLIGGEGDRSRDPSDPPYNVEMSSDPKQGGRPSRKRSEDPGTISKGGDTPIVVGGQ